MVGAGPVGLLSALALAQRGEHVLLLDPDAGPGDGGDWRRKGVMQFRHPHFFRHIVRSVLEEHAPQLWDAVVAAGCVVNEPPPGLPPWLTTVAARRSTFEGALRSAARHERLTSVAARAERVVVERDRVTGVVAGGRRHDVDRVVVAHGRAGHLADELRPPGELRPCGQAYVSRMYRARPGVEPLVSWTPIGAHYDGYLAIAFPQDDGTLSALVVRRSDDPGWSALQRNDGFDEAAAAIPNLAPWTAPERFEPITDVMRGGTLVNAYRSPATPTAGLFFVGDAVCTTNPSAGRGVSLGLLQAAALLTAWGEHPDAQDAAAAFDAWCVAQLKPWYDDHLAVDASTLRRWDRVRVEPDGPLTSDVVVAAAQVEPSLAPAVGPYLSMLAPPSSLAAAEPAVRALLRSGWQPGPDAGPTRDELVERLARSVPGQRSDADEVSQDGAGPVPMR